VDRLLNADLIPLRGERKPGADSKLPIWFCDRRGFYFESAYDAPAMKEPVVSSLPLTKILLLGSHIVCG
jgi:hypothetical protein